MTTSTSLQTLRQELCRRANEGVISQATTAASVSTLIDTGRGRGFENRTDFWKNSILKIYSGTGSGSEVTVTSFNPTTGTFTFRPTVASAISASTAYELHKLFSPTQLNTAINAAIAQGYPAWFSYVRDSTTVLATSALEYTLPATIDALTKVEIETTTTSAPQILKNWSHDVANSKLVLDKQPQAGKKLYLSGIGRPSSLSSDTDATVVDPEFIYAAAGIELLLKQLINAPNRDLQRENNLLQVLNGRVMAMRRLRGYSAPPGTAF